MPGPGNYLIGDEEKKEVLDVLESGYVSRYGDLSDPDFKHKVFSLEQEFARHCMAKHALATYSAVIFAGLIPVLVEVDESLNMDPDDIEHKITPRTKAIIPAHIMGNPCDMDRIMPIVRKHNLHLIQDLKRTGIS